MTKILILGAGFGGLETVTGLAEVLDDGYEITLVDRNDAFFIGFSKIDVLFGRATARPTPRACESNQRPCVAYLGVGSKSLPAPFS